MGSHGMRSKAEQDVAVRLGKGLRLGGFLNDLSHMDEESTGKSCMEWLAGPQQIVVMRARRA